MKSGDEIKLGESLAWNMQLDPSDRTIGDTVSSAEQLEQELSSLSTFTQTQNTFDL